MQHNNQLETLRPGRKQGAPGIKNTGDLENPLSPEHETAANCSLQPTIHLCGGNGAIQGLNSLLSSSERKEPRAGLGVSWCWHRGGAWKMGRRKRDSQWISVWTARGGGGGGGKGNSPGSPFLTLGLSGSNKGLSRGPPKNPQKGVLGRSAKIGRFFYLKRAGAAKN